MDLKTISFDEFLSQLKKSAETYFESKCISESHDDEDISFVMEKDLTDFDEETATDKFDCGFEQWHINYVYPGKNAATFSYKNLDLQSA